MPMQFEIQYDYYRRVQHDAVMLPVLQKSYFKGDRRVSGIRRIQRLWGRRVAALAALPAECGVQAFTVPGIADCRPAFAAITADHLIRACDKSQICPFCAARRVGERWSRLEARFKALNFSYDQRARYTMCLQQFRRGFAVDDTADAAADEAALLAALDFSANKPGGSLVTGAIGSVMCTSINPVKAGWCATLRSLQFLPPEVTAPQPAVSKLRKVDIVANPSLREFAAAVATVYQYPAGLLRCDVRRAALYLRVRQASRSRLVSARGVFRDRLSGDA